MDKPLLADKIALITGGSGEIGQAIVREFVKHGAKVFFTYKSNKTGAEKLEKDTAASALCCDVVSVDDISKTVGHVMSESGRVDILVNNAGVLKIGEWGSENFEDVWNEVIDTNLRGSMRFINEVLPGMKKRSFGRIVNLSSINTVMAGCATGAYQAARAGVDAITRSVAIECSRHNIRANSVAPGIIDTSVRQGIKKSIQDRHGFDLEEALMSRMPSGKFGKPEDVAHTIRYLASEESGYINGQTIFVDDGMLYNLCPKK